MIEYAIGGNQMTSSGTLADPELQRIFSVCIEYSNAEPLPPEERAICHKWINRLYKNKFGISFHPWKLQALAQLGLLTKLDASRGGDRRYYRISDPK